MALIEIGATAPDFSLKDNKGEIVTLSQFKGQKVLLSWHPLAWTSVCTDQMRALEANWDRFMSLNTVPLGMSVDPAASKTVWSAVLSIRNVRLPSDFWPHGKVASDYGIFVEKTGASERANILIDETGKVIWVKVYPTRQLPDIQEVFAVIEGK
jgi:peroxiredoxin